MPEKIQPDAEPQTPEQWLIESHREKFTRRFLWIMQKRRARYEEVVQELGEKKGVMNLYQFFTSDDPDTARYANMLGISLASLISSEFISEEELFYTASEEEQKNT
jgi:hypothetical protein